MESSTKYIKFKDYLDIKKISNKGFAVTNKGKVSNYKGEKTELYILPIFDKLFQYHTYEELFSVIQNKNMGKDEISIEGFLEVITVLFKGEIIEEYDSETEDIKVKSKMGLYGDYYGLYKMYLTNKRVAVINLAYQKDIELLINELQDLSLKEVEVVNFCNDPCKIKTTYEKVNIVNKHYSEIEAYVDNIKRCWDLVVIYSSATNDKVIRKLDEKLMEKEITFISCITNDFEISIGPLTIPHKTSCPKCNEFVSNLKPIKLEGVESDIKLSAYRVNRRAMNLIGTGLLIDDIIKYLTMESVLNPPLTLEKKISIEGVELQLGREEFIKNPLCMACNGN